MKSDFITTALTNLEPLTKIYVAYSGGVDSHVLLHLCASVPDLHSRLVAVYVHHGLQIVADDWAIHCKQVSQQLGVDFVCLRVNANANKGVSPEEAARDARYTAFKKLLSDKDVLLLAQHQDDQLETVLLQLFRGAGLQGLAGMPEISPLGRGRAIRPLLSVSRQEILQYARQQQLSWVEDPSNQSNAFDRNLLRNQVLPLLTERWPTLAATVSRSARHCAQAHTALQTEAESVFMAVYDLKLQAIDLKKLATYGNYQQRLLIRHWLQTQGLRMPSEALLSAIFEQVIAAEPSRDPELLYQQLSIKRYRHHLYALQTLSLNKDLAPETITWPSDQQQLAIGTHGLLKRVASKSGINFDCWREAKVTVRFRQGGEKIALKGRVGRHSLKKLCQEAAIPPWQRDKLPMLYFNDQLAAVADRWIERVFWTEDATKAVRMVWQDSGEQ